MLPGKPDSLKLMGTMWQRPGGTPYPLEAKRVSVAGVASRAPQPVMMTGHMTLANKGGYAKDQE